jgi:hypothetical protein
MEFSWSFHGHENLMKTQNCIKTIHNPVFMEFSWTSFHGVFMEFSWALKDGKTEKIMSVAARSCHLLFDSGIVPVLPSGLMPSMDPSSSSRRNALRGSCLPGASY